MEYILKAEGICRTYHTGTVEVHALKKCDINIKKGEFTAIVGKSGSGKSTLLRILGTLDKPDEGNVCIDGINIAELKDRQLSKFRRENIGYIYQDYSLIPEYTAYENIVLPLILDNKDIDGDEVRELMSSLQIEYCYEKYPYEMSGGEQQRVAIARALINHPAVVYADEPTGNLDSNNSRELMELFSKINHDSQTTIIMVTHDAFVASYSTKMLYMKDGKIDKILNRHGLTRDEYFNEIVKVNAILSNN